MKRYLIQTFRETGLGPPGRQGRQPDPGRAREALQAAGPRGRVRPLHALELHLAAAGPEGAWREWG